MILYLVYHTVSIYLLVFWFSGVCHSFSFDAQLHVRHRCTSYTSPSTSSYYPNHDATPLTIQWSSSPIAQESSLQSSDTQDLSISAKPSLDLHPPTIQAISQGLFIRAQNIPVSPLRFIDDGSMEEWEITLSAGKIAQSAAEELQVQQHLNPSINEEDEEVLQVMSGRVVAVLSRLDELEQELLNRCCKDDESSPDAYICLGVPEAELMAWQTSDSVYSSTQRISNAAAAIDAECLFDEQLRKNRARSLLAMFLTEIEGPGLRRNNIVIPCMNVDFLSEETSDILFGSMDDIDTHGKKADDETTDAAIAETLKDEEVDANKTPTRPSLHPITIDAIEEAFRLRAQNMTTSPLRIINEQTEWFEVQYSAVKFADRFLEKTVSHQYTEEEVQTIGGRIVGVLMRLDDLEWEWWNRATKDRYIKTIPNNLWKSTLGLHPGGVEQSCFLTLDEALSKEDDFARVRAERMLGLFLMNIEGPGLEAAGESVPGGSHPDFIEDEKQLELMKPRPKK